MKLNKITGILLGGMLLLGAYATQAADPSGTYIWSTPGRNGGPDRTNSVTLKIDGEKVTGKYSAPGRGGQAMETEITDGKITGGTEISFSTVQTFGGNSRTNKYSGKIADGTIKGKIDSVNRNGDPVSRDWEAKLQK